MKTTVNYSKTFIAILGMSCLLLSCSKDGEQGAIGPQGPQGEQGPAGAQGEAGEDGAIGTANVIYSDWISNNFSTGGGLLQKVFTLATQEEITALAVDLETSTVLVYGRGEILLAIGNEIMPLPYTTGSGIRYSYTINDGMIRAVGQTSNNSDNDFEVFDDYRYVIIPGGISTSGKSSTSLDYGKMSYNEIMDRFNIPK